MGLHAIQVLVLAVLAAVAAPGLVATTRDAPPPPPPSGYVSVLGDPDLLQPPRVMIEGWNMCNRCGDNCTVAPRYADCIHADAKGPGPNGNQVTEADNQAGVAPGLQNVSSCDAFTEAKERSLGALCLVNGHDYFWSAMLKSGNYIDATEGKLCGLWCWPNCQRLAKGVAFNNKPMNQPVMFHNWSAPTPGGAWAGAFFGTWDVNSTLAPPSAAEVAASAPVYAAAAQCNINGTWLSAAHAGGPVVPIYVSQAAGSSAFLASAKGQWANQSGSVDGTNHISIHIEGHVDTGLVSDLDAHACSRIDWANTGATWCRTPACSQPVPPAPPPPARPSYFALEWFERDGRLILRSTLRTSSNYPWLMLYTGADAAQGRKGGYPWDGRGMIHTLPESSMSWPAAKNDFLVRFRLNISSWQDTSSFYLLNMAACWKNDGRECDGDIRSDVTRYILLDLHQKAAGEGCRPAALSLCPEWHTTRSGDRIPRTDTARFPYHAYHSVAQHARHGGANGACMGFDCFSNPQEQDFIKLAPSPEWGQYGFPNSTAQGLAPGFWQINVGAVTSRVKMQGAEPAARRWHTLNIGPEMGLGHGDSGLGVWEISDFDVLVRPNTTTV